MVSLRMTLQNLICILTFSVKLREENVQHVALGVGEQQVWKEQENTEGGNGRREEVDDGMQNTQ